MEITFRRKVTSTKARQELYSLIQSALEGNDPIQILHRGQAAAVLVSDAEYRRLLAHVRNPLRLRRGLSGCVKINAAYSSPLSSQLVASKKDTDSSIFVTDTEPFLWYAGRCHRLLPSGVISAFERAIAGRCIIMVPIMVLYELSALAATKMIRLNVSLTDMVDERFFAQSIELLKLELDDVIVANLLEFEGDLSDKVAVSMAIRSRCPLITANEQIHKAAACSVFWQ